MVQAAGGEGLIPSHKAYILAGHIREGGGCVFWETRRLLAVLNIRCFLFEWWRAFQCSRLNEQECKSVCPSLGDDVVALSKSHWARKPEGRNPRRQPFLHQEFLFSTTAFVKLALWWSTNMEAKGNKPILSRQLADLAAHLVGPTPTAAMIEAVRQCSNVNADTARCNEVWGARCQLACTTLGLLQIQDAVSGGKS